MGRLTPVCKLYFIKWGQHFFDAPFELIFLMQLKVSRLSHIKWALAGDSGGSPVLENAVKRWVGPIGPICFSVYFDASP